MEYSLSIYVAATGVLTVLLRSNYFHFLFLELVVRYICCILHNILTSWLYGAMRKMYLSWWFLNLLLIWAHVLLILDYGNIAHFIQFFDGSVLLLYDVLGKHCCVTAKCQNEVIDFYYKGIWLLKRNLLQIVFFSYFGNFICLQSIPLLFSLKN